jgi:hypothetical protein
MPFGVATTTPRGRPGFGAQQPISMPILDGANVATVCPAATVWPTPTFGMISSDQYQYLPASGPLTI